jgi:hypothetical protein
MICVNCTAPRKGTPLKGNIAQLLWFQYTWINCSKRRAAASDDLRTQRILTRFLSTITLLMLYSCCCKTMNAARKENISQWRGSKFKYRRVCSERVPPTTIFPTERNLQNLPTAFRLYQGLSIRTMHLPRRTRDGFHPDSCLSQVSEVFLSALFLTPSLSLRPYRRCPPLPPHISKNPKQAISKTFTESSLFRKGPNGSS